MAYTLADYARLAASPLKAGVMEIMRETSRLMDVLSWEDATSLDIEVIRTEALPTITSRKIGGTFTESKGRVGKITERIVNVGAYIDFDKVLLAAKTVYDQKALQTKMFTQAIALHFNNLFINGGPSSDYDDLTGLRYRLINDLPAANTITNSTGLDVSPDATSLATNQGILIEQLHALCNVVGYGAGGPSHLLMNNTMKMRLEAALRASGALKTTKDAYGRKFPTFGDGGPEIVDVGPTDPLDLTTRIIGNVELADGTAITGGASTSIYAIKVGEEFLNGFQLYAPDVQDIGRLESGLADRIVIDWPLGIYHVSPFAFGRMVGVIAA